MDPQESDNGRELPPYSEHHLKCFKTSTFPTPECTHSLSIGLTIAVLQLDQQGGVVHEVVVVGNDVVMLQQRQNDNLIQGIATLLFRKSSQIDFLPHHQ